MARSIEARLARAIFVTTFAAYMLTSGREPPWGDANIQWMLAESIAKRGAFDVPKPWPDDLPPRDGKYYATYPLLAGAIQVPGVLALEGIARVAPKARPFVKPLISHLACSAFGALTCLLFFRLCRQRELSLGASSVATAILAFASTVWVYAHYSYTEVAQAALFTGFVLYLLRTDDDPTPRNARWLGLFAGLLFGLKYLYGAALIGGAAFLLWRHRRDRALLVKLAIAAATTSVPFLVLSMFYNYVCWESPLSTGYQFYLDSYFGENPAVGLWGMFLSPGKSAFLYTPPLILGLVALPSLWKHHRAVCIAILATVVPVLLVYSRYKSNGDYAWGPRFVVFSVPVLCFAFAVVIDAWRSAPARWGRRIVLAAIVAAGVFVQLLGNAFYWDHYIRISMDARTAWLGSPNRKGAIIPTRADGRCDSCFEDVHQLQWLPPFQPILGHFWLARSKLAGRDWKAATADAPWRRHTSLDLNIAGSYARVRFDWWGMLWIDDFPQYRAAGIVILLLLLAATAFGAWLWIRAHRASGADPPAA